jgi:hypothetical protein
MLQPGFELAKAEDMRIPQCVDTADEAIAIIREHQSRWRNRRCDGPIASPGRSNVDHNSQSAPEP